MDKILVIGGSGQLGRCIEKLVSRYVQFEFFFPDSKELDITSESSVDDYFYDVRPQFCINTAAYTQVDKAEEEKEKAFAANAAGVAFVASACAEYRTMLIQISTDYVFDGNTNLPYEEGDWTHPTGVYGLSKEKGERLALDENPKTIVIRTSWLYSEFGKNFVKTMLRLFQSNNEISIVNDQFGQPTNANDLAKAIMKIILSPIKKYGIYHFSNYGEATWFDFAKEIADLGKAEVRLRPISTQEYPTAARRPMRSTLCLDKIEQDYHVEPVHWQNSLEKVIDLMEEL